MTTYRFFRMTEDCASAIAKWNYEGPYSFYDMEDSEETMEEFMNGDYFYALNPENELIGFICKGNSTRVPGGYKANLYSDIRLDIGLGLKPELTSRGLGFDYLTSAIQFLEEQYDVHDFQLAVATFNERAIKVYERVGFNKGIVFKSKVGEQDVDFLSMNLPLHGTPDK